MNRPYKKVITIHQPDFLPWLGFFHRWAISDLFIMLDDVQFARRGWHHRDKIKTAHGVKWLTVPVKAKGRYSQQIREVEIDNDQDWQCKHLNIIYSNYREAPVFDMLYDQIEAIYYKKHNYLIDFNIHFLRFVASKLGITTPIDSASNYNVKSTSTQRLVDLVRSVGGTDYLTGLGSKDYLDESLFSRDNINVKWQKYQHPMYKQLHGDFIPMLSSLDFLMAQEPGSGNLFGGYCAIS